MSTNSTLPSSFKKEHYIIGIGASAGGLEPIHELFANMPVDTPFSFIIIQHLSPDHKSLMGELLSKHTSIKVCEAKDGMPVEPNRIYLIPNKKTLTLGEGKLRLHEKDRHHVPNDAIDKFFESLAEEKGEYGVGIILSGSGTDGTKGVEAIKKHGGFVIVQDPATADFDSMPISAINTSCYDLILSPTMMAQEITEFLQDLPYLKSLEKLNRGNEAVVEEILQHIRQVTPHDFSQYKKPTLTRRLAKRMQEKGFQSLPEYKIYLQHNHQETLALAKEFLINVTRFFRDPEAFEELKTKIIPSIFSSKQTNDTIKIWCVACSSGEEAYSLAILFYEYMDTLHNHDFNVKIFATDIDKDAIQIASLGMFPETIAKHLSDDRLNKFFTREGQHYRINPVIRKMVVFAYHDISKDPPFSKLDMISCRNMLIYMSPTLQKQVLKTFLFAINTGAILFLGTSENIGLLKDAMKEVSKKWKIYKCIDKNKIVTTDRIISPLQHIFKTQSSSATRPKDALQCMDEIFKEMLLEENRYAGILIDEHHEVKQAMGRFKDFLLFPDDNLTFNLLKLVEPDLAVALGICTRKALNENEKTVMRHVRVGAKENERNITISVKPFINQQEYQQSFLFVVLYEEELTRKKESYIIKEFSNHPEHIEALERELRETKENLQTLIEELESTNEELMTGNEEMVAANEELQSTNEELQSLNEELHTVSAEHQLKIKELIELNDDLNNYFANSEIGQVLIDKHLIIRKFSPAITKQINLIDTDIGRSIYDITNNLTDVELIDDIKKVIENNKGLKKEVVTRDNKTYLMKINSYIRQDQSVDGVVINFIDITEIKNLNSILRGVFESSPNGIIAIKATRNDQNEIINFEYTAANTAAERILNAGSEPLEGGSLLKQFSIHDDFFKRGVRVVETGDADRFEFRKEENQQWFEVTMVKMMDGLVTTFTDITQKKKAADLITKSYEDLKITSDQLQETNARLEQSNMDLLQFASVASHDLKEPLRKIQTFGNFLSSKIETKLEPTEKNYLDKIINASQRMQNLIEDVLTLSKLSNKDIPFVPTDLNVTLQRILEDLEIIISEKKCIIDIDPLPTIEAVPGQMRQLFQNLLSNALKFNTSATPIVKVKHRVITTEEAVAYNIDEKDYEVISVEDNGIGFDERFKETIFGLFQRLNPARYHGTGIGLAICKKIIDNHLGFIRAESKTGIGSMFTMVIPKKHQLHRQPSDDVLVNGSY